MDVVRFQYFDFSLLPFASFYSKLKCFKVQSAKVICSLTLMESSQRMLYPSGKKKTEFCIESSRSINPNHCIFECILLFGVFLHKTYLKFIIALRNNQRVQIYFILFYFHIHFIRKQPAEAIKHFVIHVHTFYSVLFFIFFFCRKK